MSFESSESETVTHTGDDREADDGRTPLALAAGLVAALVAGGLWAALVYVTNMELGYAAWGIGLLVALAMGRVTQARTQQLAYAAAVLAFVGLLARKAFKFAGSAGPLAKRLMNADEIMKSASRGRCTRAGNWMSRR